MFANLTKVPLNILSQFGDRSIEHGTSEWSKNSLRSYYFRLFREFVARRCSFIFFFLLQSDAVFSIIISLDALLLRVWVMIEPEITTYWTFLIDFMIQYVVACNVQSSFLSLWMRSTAKRCGKFTYYLSLLWLWFHPCFTIKQFV